MSRVEKLAVEMKQLRRAFKEQTERADALEERLFMAEAAVSMYKTLDTLPEEIHESFVQSLPPITSFEELSQFQEHLSSSALQMLSESHHAPRGKRRSSILNEGYEMPTRSGNVARIDGSTMEMMRKFVR